MSVLSLRLPDSLHDAVRELAADEHVSINHLVTLALAEKISALKTAKFFAARAQEGSRAGFERTMARVPKVDPPEYDRIED